MQRATPCETLSETSMSALDRYYTTNDHHLCKLIKKKKKTFLELIEAMISISYCCLDVHCLLPHQQKPRKYNTKMIDVLYCIT